MNTPNPVEQQTRLAEIRTQWMMWSAREDTSTWEVTFFLKLLEQKDREIAELRKALCH
jgi:hypothetical protein